MIARVATVLGDDNVNISRMQVAQKSYGALGQNTDDISIMIINTDGIVKEETLEKIAKLDGIEEAKFIELNVE
jgi:hypothetical protein